MSKAKRAFLYISRNKTKTILLVIILAVLMLISLNGIAIKSSVDRESKEIKAEYGSSFIIQNTFGEFDSDYEVVEKDGTTIRIYKGPNIINEAIEKICSIPGVIGYNEGGWSGVYYFNNIDLIPGSISYKYDTEERDIATGEYDISDVPDHDDDYIWCHSTACYSNLDPECDAFFQNGSFELDSGRMISKDDTDVAMISKQLAEMNGLKLGDYIGLEIRETLIDPMGDPDKVISSPTELEIIGIYRVNFSFESSIYTPESENPENFIYIPRNTAKLLTSISNAYMDITPSEGYSKVEFYIDDPSKMDEIKQEVKSLDCINWQFCEIKTNDATYTSLLKPLETVGNYSNLMLFLSFGAGSVLTAFIIVMQLRSRKKELSIYSSLGFQNKEIRMQLIIEIIIIIVISFLIMLLLSLFLSGPLTEMITNADSIQASNELYSVESTDLGVEITQTAGALPKIDINNKLGDYVVVIIVYSIIMITTICITSKKVLKKNN